MESRQSWCLDCLVICCNSTAMLETRRPDIKQLWANPVSLLLPSVEFRCCSRAIDSCVVPSVRLPLTDRLIIFVALFSLLLPSGEFRCCRSAIDSCVVPSGEFRCCRRAIDSCVVPSGRLPLTDRLSIGEFRCCRRAIDSCVVPSGGFRCCRRAIDVCVVPSGEFRCCRGGSASATGTGP